MKTSTPTLKKPVLSSSAGHTSSASNLTRTFISSKLDNEDSTEIKNKKDTSNADDIHSCVTPREKDYSVQATPTSPRLTLLNATLPIVPVDLQKTTKLPPVGK